MAGLSMWWTPRPFPVATISQTAGSSHGSSDFQVDGDAAFFDHLPGVPHDRQSALGEDVEFDQPDRLDAVHVEMGRGIALGAHEGRGVIQNRIAGKHHPAGVHLGITGKAVQDGGKSHGGPGRLLGEGIALAFHAVGNRLGNVPGGDVGDLFGQPPNLKIGQPRTFPISARADRA